MLENYNLNPYYDDFDGNKDFYRLLFKPTYAVQARELTQIQSLMQNQINRFGDHIFKSGSMVNGGDFYYQTATSLKIDDSFSNTDINVLNFEGKTLYSEDGTKRAEVIKVYDADQGVGDPKTLIVKQLFGEPFANNEIIKTNDVTPYSATISSNGVNTAKTFSVNEGIFYFKGLFVRNSPQTIAISKYTDANVNCRIGFAVTESIVKSSSDTSLLDPALGSSNYQAPGADRIKIDLQLEYRSVDSVDDERFIELTRVEDSILTKKVNDTSYANLADELAKRTYDESGNYTVKPFEISIKDNVANSAQTDIILSPGKAYVYGYEFVRSVPTTLTVDKPREQKYEENKRVSGSYGNYIYITNQYGALPVNNMGPVDIHCVPTSSINFTSPTTVSYTKIGTAKVKAIEYDSTEDTTNTKFNIYRTYLYDVSVSNSIIGTTGIGGSTKTLINVKTSGATLSSVNDAYKGAKFSFTTGVFSGYPVRTITAYNGTDKTITVDGAYPYAPEDSVNYRIDFDIGDSESFLIRNGTTNVAMSDIHSLSKDPSTQDTFLQDTKSEPTIYNLGQSFLVENSIGDISYSYRREYKGTLSGGEFTFDLGYKEELGGASTSLDKNTNYLVTITDGTGSSYSTGQILLPNQFEVSNSTTMTVVNGGSAKIDVVATISKTNLSSKLKTFVTANTNIIANSTTSAIYYDVYANNSVMVYENEGQIYIPSHLTNKIPGEAQVLFLPDAYKLSKVLEFPQGVEANTVNMIQASDRTALFTLDTGQKDSYYDHSSIRLNRGAYSPTGNLVVFIDYFKSQTGPGYYTLDSYVKGGLSYGDIPSYSSVKAGTTYNLRDCMDFRPTRKRGISNFELDIDSTGTGPRIPRNSDVITLDYNYYLPRIDKIVLDKTTEFQVVKGISSVNPTTPLDTPTGMTMYILTYGAYVANSSQISVEYKNNKRYTMSDIGKLENRIINLEYYTSLSLLEQNTLSKKDLTIRDATTGLDRMKNGILVDAFTGSSVADVTNKDYSASIDPTANELRPSFNITSYSLVYDAANSRNCLQNGPFVTSTAASQFFIDQPKVSKILNINPFNVINYVGKVKLDPASDIWVNTKEKPDLLVDMTGDKEAWSLLTENATKTEWNSWQTYQTGVSVTGGAWQGVSSIGLLPIYDTKTTTTSEHQARTGTKSTVVASTISKSLGNRVVDISIIPYMREVGISFLGTDFKPSWPLYPFFENIDVRKYVAKANKFILSGDNLTYGTKTSDYDYLLIKDNPSDSTIYYKALAARISGNELFVLNTGAYDSTSTYIGKYLVGYQSGTFNTQALTSRSEILSTLSSSTKSDYRQIIGYEHWSGQATSATTNTIVLSRTASGANNATNNDFDNSTNPGYKGQTIRIIRGTGAGQSRVITSYDSTTRTATLSEIWTTIPDATSSYSLGELKSNKYGDVAGVFIVPDGVFRAGEKTFRLVDNLAGDIGSSASNGDANFYAQGLLQTTEETILSTTVPTIQRQSVNDYRTVTSSTSERVIVGYYDPLAQTFLISPTQYPDGIFLSKVRVCFKSKDDVVPVTLQIRPTVNGYPSSSVIYPHGSVTLTPDKVKITDYPSLDDVDNDKWTEFAFDSPIYMQPGEHSFVLLANSNKYETYVAVKDDVDIMTGRLISEQPYGGSLFMSQNGSTWTADQWSDMMFRMFRYSFSTSPSYAQFLIDYPETSATPYDLTHLIAGDLALPNTSLSYSFTSEKWNPDTSTYSPVGEQPINNLTNYDMSDDGIGTRELAVGKPSTFTLKCGLNNINSDASPILDVSRMGFLCVTNIINGLPVSNNILTLVDGGAGYTSKPTITISGGGGSGAYADCSVNVTSGKIESLWVLNGGSGYYETPSITFSGGGASTNATAIISGETSKGGGTASARYITRPVTLNSGFDSKDLRVYLTAYRPKNARIYVYAKVLSDSDPESWDDKSWTLLTQVGNPNYVSSSKDDYFETTYAPGTNGKESNSLSYTGNDGSVYNKFRVFSIKIVMSITDNNTSSVPKIRDLRVVALQ